MQQTCEEKKHFCFFWAYFQAFQVADTNEWR